MIDLDAAEKLANAATPGDWHAGDCVAPRIILYAVPKYRPVSIDETLTLGCVYADSAGQGRHNLRFIAASRQLVPALIAEVRQLRNENEAERKLHEETSAAQHKSARAVCQSLAAQVATLTAEVRRLSDDLERWRNAGICPNCGRGKFDEDGCCSTCGCDVIGFVDGKVVRPLPDAPDTSNRLSDVDAMAGRLKAIVGPLWSEAYCVEVAKGLVGR